MRHPFEHVLREAEGFLLIGDSSKDRFPGYSYDAYTRAGKRFYCLDLGGLTESRGPTSGGKVYTAIDELPPERGELAIVWTHPHDSKRAVDLAKQAGYTQIWFSFGAGHRDAVARAREIGLTVLEVGRCPVFYLPKKPAACAAHTALVKLTGTYRKAPQLDATSKRREIW